MKKKIALLMACTMAAASLAGCGGGNSAKETTAAAAPAGTTAAAAGETTAAAAPAGDVAMTMFWWGNQVRNERTQAALDLYSETNGVKLDGQFAEWSDYWNKLATSAAGHAMPDVVQMDYMYLDQYAKSGLLVDLNHILRMEHWMFPRSLRTPSLPEPWMVEFMRSQQVSMLRHFIIIRHYWMEWESP